MVQQKVKKRRGRPVTIEADALISMRLPRQVLNRIENAAKEDGMSRSDAIREATERWLEERGYRAKRKS